jgi:acyl-CoA thioesterase
VTTRFERDTAVTPAGDGAFEGRIDGGWRIVRGANGGHLAAIVLRAMMLADGDGERAPRTLTVHFTRPPVDDTAIRVTAATERAGRTTSTLTARLTQDGKLVAIALASFSTPRRGPEFAEISMPEVPRPEDLRPVDDRPDFPFGRHFDFRRALGPKPGERSETAEHGVWMRLREPQLPDYAVVTQLCDAWAPAVFARLGEGGGGAGVPTVEMTYYYREVLPPEGARPDDWYLGIFRTTLARGGFIEEDGWLWSRAGTLLAQSRQLAILETR